MAAPIVQWFNQQNTVQQTSWAVGTVDAGSESNEVTFLIWNNRGGNSAVSDMTNCTITTKDITGDNGDPDDETGRDQVVLERWVQVKCVSRNDANFTSIGGDKTHPIGNAPGSNVIAGKANDGTTSGSGKDCHAVVTLKAVVPPTAIAGQFDFLTRVSYQYV